MGPGPTQAKFYDRAVIHSISRAITYDTDRAGLWVRRASAIANGCRLSHQVMTGCYGLAVTARLWCALTLKRIGVIQPAIDYSITHLLHIEAAMCSKRPRMTHARAEESTGFLALVGTVNDPQARADTHQPSRAKLVTRDVSWAAQPEFPSLASNTTARTVDIAMLYDSTNSGHSYVV